MVDGCFVSSRVSVAYFANGPAPSIYIRFDDSDGDVVAFQEIPSDQVSQFVDAIRLAAAEARTVVEMGQAMGTA